MKRRAFLGVAGSGALLASLPATACWWSNVYKNISSYVPVALLAFDRIVAILIEHGVNTTGLTDVGNAVKAAFADIQTAVLEYHDAHEHDKATLMQAISVAMKIASHRLVEFWERLQIPNEHLAHGIKALIDVMVSTLTAFIGQLSPGTPVANQKFISEPKLRSIKQFREDFNWVLDHNGLSKYAL